MNAFVIEKMPSGGLPICLDLKPLKKSSRGTTIVRYLVHKFSNQQCMKFSSLDVKSGFWHYKLPDSSQPLTTFGTPFGNFKYKSIRPMQEGLNQPTATRLHQQVLHSKVRCWELQGLEGVDIIQDDCLIERFGRTDRPSPWWKPQVFLE